MSRLLEVVDEAIALAADDRYGDLDRSVLGGVADALYAYHL
jgi:hypothetical protein